MTSLRRLRGRNFITRTMDLVCFSETSVSTFVSARRQMSDDNFLNTARCAGLKNYGQVNVSFFLILYFQSATAQVLIYFGQTTVEKLHEAEKTTYTHIPRLSRSPTFRHST